MRCRCYTQNQNICKTATRSIPNILSYDVNSDSYNTTILVWSINIPEEYGNHNIKQLFLLKYLNELYLSEITETLDALRSYLLFISDKVSWQSILLHSMSKIPFGQNRSILVKIAPNYTQVFSFKSRSNIRKVFRPWQMIHVH